MVPPYKNIYKKDSSSGPIFNKKNKNTLARESLGKKPPIGCGSFITP